jgi:hypothetical protein
VRAFVIAGLAVVAAIVGGGVPAAAATHSAPAAAVHREMAPRGADVLPSTPPTAVSCGSTRACLAVGSTYATDGTGVTPTTARAWDGKKWRSFRVPVPEGGKGAELQQASCPSATACVAVGDYVTNGQTDDARFYAMTWNGTALRATAPVPLPKGDDFAYLQAVSCVTARDCVALGYASDAAGDNVNIAEHWNGATWAMRVQPAAIGRNELQLNAIDCLSATRCEVAGQLTPSNSDTFGLFFGTWNGRSLDVQKAPLPAGAHMAIVAALSCAAWNHCAATGLSQITSTTMHSFAETWDGRAWTATTLAAPKGAPVSWVSGVSCPSARLCVAVGSASSSETSSANQAEALAYNGKTWSQRAVPSLGNGKIDAFDSVSCPSAKLCVALGGSGPKGSAEPSPLAGFWNGRTWRLAAA